MPSPPPESGAVQRLVLTGFMGSGKSTVGRLLAEGLGWTFVDLDTAVEAHLGLPVPAIFAQSGEEAFRAAEVHELGLLLTRSQQVVALGGGAPGTPAVQQLLSAAGETLVLHLQAPFPLLYERCRVQALDPAATDRPLLGDTEAAGRRFVERQALYERVAHHAVDASATPATVAGAIFNLLRPPR